MNEDNNLSRARTTIRIVIAASLFIILCLINMAYLLIISGVGVGDFPTALSFINVIGTILLGALLRRLWFLAGLVAFPSITLGVAMLVDPYAEESLQYISYVFLLPSASALIGSVFGYYLNIYVRKYPNY